MPKEVANACFYLCSLSIKFQCDTADKPKFSHPGGCLVICGGQFKKIKNEQIHANRQILHRRAFNRTRLLHVPRLK